MMDTPTAPSALPEHLASKALYAPGEQERPRLDRAEMLRYLGHGDQELEEELTARIEAAAAEAEHLFAPRGVRQVFAVDVASVDGGGLPCIRLAGTAIELTGRDIYRHLKDARACAVLACTLGMESERRLRGMGVREALDAALLDAACSAYIEAAIEEMDAAVRRDAAACGLNCNWRFSCGYGDCPLTAQPRIVAALDATRLIGLTVTPSSLLLPSKSVTALIGLFEGEPSAADSARGCAGCRLRDACRFRAAGMRCHS